MLIEAYPEYIQGHLKRGHYECNIPDDEYIKIKDNRNALINYIRANGDLLVDDWEIDDVGSIESIHTFY